MKSEPPPHPLGPSFSLSAHLFTFYHGGISKLSQIPLQPLWLTYSLSESEPFFPYSSTGTRLQVLHPSTPVRQSHAQAAGTPRRDAVIEAIEGMQGGRGKTKTKKRHFSPVWYKHSLLESHRTVLGAISTELGGAGRGRRRKRNGLSFR